MFFPSYGRGNGKQALIDEAMRDPYIPPGSLAWDDENADPVQDIRDFIDFRERMRRDRYECDWYVVNGELYRELP
jgi:hypothetical protein